MQQLYDFYEQSAYANSSSTINHQQQFNDFITSNQSSFEINKNSKSNVDATKKLQQSQSEHNDQFKVIKANHYYITQLSALGLHNHNPSYFMVDNASTITLSSEFSGNHKRIKHFIGQVNFIDPFVTVINTF